MGTSGDMLGTGVSALLATQRSLATVSHNISNVNTEGYNRQTVSLSARIPQPAGNGFIGTGVQSLTVQRVYDQFINTQVLVNSASSGRLDSYYQFASQVDNLLADANTGLSPGLKDFFNATHDVATDPTSIPARQVMLSQGQSLVDRFHTLNANLDAMSRGVDQDLGNEVTTVNSLAGSIAKLNNDISLAMGMAGGQPPNDLMDQRDQLIEQLSEHVSVQVISQDDGSKNVFIGNGQNLVIGNTAATLSVTANQYDAAQSEISLTLGSNSVVVSNNLSGGSIGGLIEFRDQILNPARNQLGRLAIGIAQSVNDQHQAGMTLDGNLGQDFFTLGSPQVLDSTSNTGSAVVTAQIGNVATLTADDYTLNYNGSNYLLTNNTTNSTQTLGAAGPFTVAGMTINVSGSANAGDRFTIRPTRDAAAGIQMAVSNPRDIAAASPIAAAAAAANTGTGAISSTAVTDITNAAFTTSAGALSPPISIRFTSPTTYEIVNTTTSAVLDTGSYTPGSGKDVFPSDNLTLDYGYQVHLTGTPATGDTFTVNYNTGGTGDNRNALALAGLQTKGALDNGRTTYEQAYGQLVSSVSTQTHSAQLNLAAQTTLLSQSKEQRASMSGVNLDEEAANMLRFQQAYQAAAQVIATASSMFDTLLNAVRS